ncbi:MAG: GNAT family N-acetyltransferase [Muribaculaceae bacterium]|nr:GNAT family N-acetyltransferase [Muribaculaceae bacterium]
MIREVTIADSSRIAEIYNHYIDNSVITFETERITGDDMKSRILSLTEKGFPFLVAEQGGEVAGYCYAHEWKTKAAYSRTWETTIYLSHESCHNGMGKIMMEKLIQISRERGAHVLIACITGDNTSSLHFHSSFGFQDVSHFHNVGYKHGRWLDVIDMELQL